MNERLKRKGRMRYICILSSFRLILLVLQTLKSVYVATHNISFTTIIQIQTKLMCWYVEKLPDLSPSVTLKLSQQYFANVMCMCEHECAVGPFILAIAASNQGYNSGERERASERATENGIGSVCTVYFIRSDKVSQHCASKQHQFQKCLQFQIVLVAKH